MTREEQAQALLSELQNMRYIDRLQPSDKRRIAEIKSELNRLEQSQKDAA